MDEERHFVEEKDQRLRVGIGVTAVLILGVIAVIRFGRGGPETSSEEAQAAVQKAFDDNTRRVAESAPELPIAGGVIEFELVVGDKRYDIIPNRAIELSPDLALEIAPLATWTAGGDGFHFRHASNISVATDGTMTIATEEGDVLELVRVEPAVTATEVATRAHGLVGTATPTTRLIAGADRSGVRHDTAAGMTLETYVVALGEVHVAVLLFRRDPDAQLGALAELLGSLAPGAAAPTPQFALRGTELVVDRPARLADPPLTVTVRRRATIVRTIDTTTSTKYTGTLTFEHPPGFAVARVPNPAMLAISITSPRVGVQLVQLPIHVSFDELRASLVGALRVRDEGEIVRGTGARTVRGRKLALEHAPVVTEIYLLERGTKQIGVMVQYHRDDAATAGDLALPVLVSVQ